MKFLQVNIKSTKNSTGKTKIHELNGFLSRIPEYGQLC